MGTPILSSPPPAPPPPLPQDTTTATLVLMADFFLEVKTKGRGGSGRRSVAHRGKKRRRPPPRSGRKGRDKVEDAISSSSSEGGSDGRLEFGGGSESSSEDPYAHETPAMKRARLARQFIDTVAGESGSDSDDVGERLYAATLKASGRYKQEVADGLELDGVSASHGKHRLAPTAVAVRSDDAVVFSGSKDGTIVAWDVETNTKWLASKGARLPPRRSGLDVPAAVGTGHGGAIYALAVGDSPDLLASTGEDRTIRVWDVRLSPREAAGGVAVAQFAHRKPVYAAAFRRGADSLYTAGEDRVVKVWAGESAGFVETLYGHEAAVRDIDALVQDRALTGSEDGTIRIWKVLEQTQLVFKTPGRSPVERVSFINQSNFAVATADGALSLFSAGKRTPLVRVEGAHAPESGPTSLKPISPLVLPSQVTARKSCTWATALAAAKYTDLLASGSSTGQLKFWKVGQHCRSLTQVSQVPIPGFINDLAWANSGRFVVAAVGREHRLGRWWRLPGGENGARNRVCLINTNLDLDSNPVAEQD